MSSQDVSYDTQLNTDTLYSSFVKAEPLDYCEEENESPDKYWLREHSYAEEELDYEALLEVKEEDVSDLEAQDEELSTQGEELSTQGEELSTQDEELSTQGEELSTPHVERIDVDCVAVKEEPNNEAWPAVDPLQLPLGRYACVVCNERFEEKAVMLSHLDAHYATALLCDKCSRVFESKTQLQVHYEEKHPDWYRYECDRCKLRFRLKVAVARHVAHAECARHVCVVCLRAFNSPQLLATHARSHMHNTAMHARSHTHDTAMNARSHMHNTATHDTATRAFTCVQGELHFEADSASATRVISLDSITRTRASFRSTVRIIANKPLLRTHTGIRAKNPSMRTNSKTRAKKPSLVTNPGVGAPSLGSNPGTRAKNPSVIPSPQPIASLPSIPSESETAKRPVSCQHETSLAQHQYKGLHSCHLCNLSFVLRANLEAHTATHTNATHKCSHCGMNCLTALRLAIHIATHTIHKCTHCGMNFSTARRLATHTATHNCVDCGMHFSPSALASHVCPLESRRYSCADCHLKFRFEPNYRVHLLTHLPYRLSGGGGVQCPMCKRRFRYWGHLENHTLKKACLAAPLAPFQTY